MRVVLLRRNIRFKQRSIKRRAVFTVFFVLAAIIAFILLVAISSLTNADKLMKKDGEAVPPYATNRFSS